MDPDIVVGAGPAGCVVAERLAAAGRRVLVVEKRNHIGGNAFDELNEQGILIHRYGPHAFHTDRVPVWDYLSRFAEWNVYQHRVLACVDGKQVPVPVNLDTVNQVFGMALSAGEMEAYLHGQGAGGDQVPQNAEEMAISRVGYILYDKIFKNYTKKQWGVWPHELEPEVTARIPVRYSRDSRYFTDRYQGLPLLGYTRMFESMLEHPNICVQLQTDFLDIRRELKWNRLIYTGPLDEYFDFRHGRLPYRSLRFDYETLPQQCYQAAGSVNYPNEYEFTRITEFKHLTGQAHPWTTICREYPQNGGEPYYPVPQAASRELRERYLRDVRQLEKVFFVGRLAEYQYLNMDVVVEHALQLAEKLVGQ